MKLTWSPESAGRAYLEAVRLLGQPSSPEDSDTACLVAAMAGGFSPRLILEAPSSPYLHSPSTTSLALLAVSRLSGARLVCLLPPGTSSAPTPHDSLEVVPADSIAKVDDVDFAVVDCERVDATGILRTLRVGPRGAVVVCKGSGRGAAQWWKGLVSSGNRVVRSAVLPIGKGIEILHVGVGKGPSLTPSTNRSRWIRHVDATTGEEHVFRR